MCLLAALALLVASCGGNRGRRHEPPYQVGGPACLRALAARGVAVEPWAAPRQFGVCRVDTPVRATAGRTLAFSPALETSCAMLLAWADLEPEVQAAARRHLGAPLRSVRHYGSHGCRRVNGSSTGRLSLHATARALDVSAFGLADGRTLNVRDGWDGGTRRERRFLRAVRDAACRRLSVVLDPDSDRHHQDHIHMDLGGWKLCGGR